MLDERAFQPEREGHAAAVEIADRPEAGSTEKLTIFSGVSWATSSMSMPPSVEATKEMRLVWRSISRARYSSRAMSRAVFDVDAVDLLAGGAGLVRDEGAAQHLAGQHVGLGDRAGEADAALFAGLGFLEVALAAAARVDLRLDHPERAVKSACRRLGLFGLQHHAAVGNRGAEAAQKRLGLILVDVHASCPVWCELRPDAT